MPLSSPLVLLALAATLAMPLGARAQSGSGFLAVANQVDHTALLVDLSTNAVLAKVEVGVNGHELAVSPDRRLAYVPIYGNSGVGKPGTDGHSIDIVDLQKHALAGHIDLGKAVRPHCAKFGPGGYLYVSAELASAVYIVDVNARKVIGEIPTGAIEAHMFVLSPDGHRLYTANVGAGSVSVLDVDNRKLLKVIPVSRQVQRISISPDGRHVYTHDQDSSRIAVIDTATSEVREVRDWIKLPASVYSSAITSDGRSLLANSTSGKLFVWDLQTGKLANTFDIPPANGEISINSSNSRAYVSCPSAGNIQILNLQTWKLEVPLTLTRGVDGLAWFATPE